MELSPRHQETLPNPSLPAFAGITNQSQVQQNATSRICCRSQQKSRARGPVVYLAQAAGLVITHIFSLISSTDELHGVKHRFVFALARAQLAQQPEGRQNLAGGVSRRRTARYTQSPKGDRILELQRLQSPWIFGNWGLGDYASDTGGSRHRQFLCRPSG